MRLLLFITATLAVFLAGPGLSPTPAKAHARYERSEPADGAVIAESPARVDVWYSQEVRRSGGLPTLIVVNDSGDTLSTNTVLDDSDRHHVYAELPPALAPGLYTVIWHTLSDDDGEEAQGAFHYFVGEAPTDTITPTIAETPTPSADRTPTPTPTTTPPTPDEDDDDSEIPIWALLVGIVAGLAVGGGAGAVLGRRLQR